MALKDCRGAARALCRHPSERIPALPRVVRAPTGIPADLPGDPYRGSLGTGQAPLPVHRGAHRGTGHALVTIFVDDLDGRVASSAARGVEPELRETYDNGVRKITFRDPDGNWIGFGGAPLEA